MWSRTWSLPNLSEFPACLLIYLWVGKRPLVNVKIHQTQEQIPYHTLTRILFRISFQNLPGRQVPGVCVSYLTFQNCHFELQRLSSSARLNLGHGVWQRLHSTNILLLPYISHLPLQLNLGHLMKSDPYRINGSNAPCVVSGLQQLRIGVLLWTELYPPKLISWIPKPIVAAFGTKK
jgi:hypothetical protein